MNEFTIAGTETVAVVYTPACRVCGAFYRVYMGAEDLAEYVREGLLVGQPDNARQLFLNGVHDDCSGKE